MAEDAAPPVTAPHVATVRLPYRLTEKSFFNSILQPAGTVLHLLPHEVTPTMLKVPVGDLLATSLKGAVAQSVASPIAGFLPLNVGGHIDQPHRVTFERPRRLRFTSTADLSGIMFVLFGIAGDGNPETEQLRGPATNPEVPWIETKEEYLTVTGLMASGPVSNLTIDALETPEEITLRLDAQSERRRLLWEKAPRTPDEAAEVEELLARRQALQGMKDRTPDQEEELRRLVADLPGPAEAEVTELSPPAEDDPALLPLDPDETGRLLAREFAAPVSRETPPAGAPLSAAEAARLQALRDSPTRTELGDAEMNALAARETPAA